MSHQCWLLEIPSTQRTPHPSATLAPSLPRGIYRWFGEWEWTLIEYADDATSQLLEAVFVPTQSTQSYFMSLAHSIRRHGLPVAIYSDSHSVFSTQPGSDGHRCLTSFGQTLKTLGIIHKQHPEVLERLAILECFEKLTQQENIPVRRAVSYLGVSVATLYRWRKSYQCQGLAGLVKASRCPRRLRRRQWQVQWVEAIIRLRKKYPYWGKRKIRCLLLKEGITLSGNRVGRIISHLIQQGEVVRAHYTKRFCRSASRKRPWAQRGWGGLSVVPGEVVQVDTLTVSQDGRCIKQFTATDKAVAVL